MKLWQKISLICSVVLLVAVSSCCAVLLRQTTDKLLSMTYQQAEEKQERLLTSFQEMSDYYSTREDPLPVQRSVLYYCFSSLADSSAALTVGGETLYSLSDIQPQAYLPLSKNSTQSRFTGVLDGRNYLVVGSPVRLSAMPDTLCCVYVVEDISGVYEAVRHMLWQFVLIGAGCSAVGLLLIIFLIRRAMAPLEALEATACRIAQGNYQERSDIRSRDEVGALAASFNQMAQSVQQHVEELTQTARRQRLFIGGVTHEFKTPLTTILLSADTLQNTYLSEDEQLEVLDKIRQQGQWLERLVQKMLRLLTLNQAVTRGPISVSELLERVRESTADTLSKGGILLETHCHSEVLYGDWDLLQSALVNLVDNAGKASAPGQTITLCAYGNTLEVADRGTGIPQEALSHITEPFYMVDKSRSKKLGGVGLGLALVKEIVQAHQADLEIQSEPGKGTTVRIRFPGNQTVTGL